MNGPPEWLERCANCGCIRGDHCPDDPRNPGLPCQGCGPDCSEYEPQEGPAE